MCRLVAYVGEPLSLDEIVLSPPHSLRQQSFAARELLRGSVCADGFGVGWYADGDPEPALYRRECPIWADPDLAGVLRVTRSGCAIASVRNATPEVGHVGAAAVQPFAQGRYLFSHNGFVASFTERAREFRSLLPDDLYAAHRGGGDSETLFLIVLAHVREVGGDLAEGTATALAHVAERAPGSALNVVASDGRVLVASRFRADEGEADSLYSVRRDGGFLIASEPLDDDPAWAGVAAGTLVVFDGAADTTITLEVAS
jgi:glutamine amidotransferase